MTDVVPFKPVERQCTKCGELRPLAHFYRKTNGRSFSRCKGCVAEDKAEYWIKNKNRLSEKYRATRLAVKPSGLTSGREWDLQSRYGMPAYEYDRRLKLQGYKCACCNGPLNKICIDHDHQNGKVRGIICRNCNLMLGHAKDSVEVLRKAIKYLRGGRLPSQR